MSTDTRGKLIARLEETPRLCRMDGQVHVPAGLWRQMQADRQEAARLLREDGERGGVPLPDYADERANPLDRWCSVGRIRAMERVATTAAELFHDLDGTPADYSDQEVALMTALADLDIVESRDADTEPPAVSARTAPSRAALSALYLEAHRAGVEAAVDYLYGVGDAVPADLLKSDREDLTAQAREYLASEGVWTDPGSALAQALAHPAAGGDARERVAEILETWMSEIDEGVLGAWAPSELAARILAALRGEEVGNG